jgi:2'-5' RNA ligase
MTEAKDKVPTRRLFLALWPSATERRQVMDLARSITGGRTIKAENLHLTLIFLGATDSQRQQCYEQALQHLEVPSFTLTLDAIGYWFKPRILWLGTSRPPTALATLVKELKRLLGICGFKPEARPFSAHVTLARRFPGPAPSSVVAQPVVWSVNRIALVESCTQAEGGCYQALRYWPGD